jgi:hypothetical protein
MQPTFDYDICERKHGGNANSIEANKKVSPHKKAWRFLVLDFIKQRGTATLEDICQHYGKEKNTLSGRVSDLKKFKLIEEAGTDERGFSIYRPTA